MNKKEFVRTCFTLRGYLPCEETSAKKYNKVEKKEKKMKGIMKECLETRGYFVTDEKLNELWEIYEDCQEWDEEKMVTGMSYDEIEDFVKHSSSVDKVFENKSKEYRQGLQLIPDWKNKEYRCYFCGTTKSVKYTEEIFDPVINDRGLSKVCVCNRCALLHIGK